MSTGVPPAPGEPGCCCSPPPPSATYWDTQATSWGSLKMSWLVLLLCISCPLTLQRMRRLWTSAEEVCHPVELEKSLPPCPVPTCHRVLGDNSWPYGTEGIKGLPQQPLPPIPSHLPVPGTDVVGHSEAHDVLHSH